MHGAELSMHGAELSMHGAELSMHGRSTKLRPTRNRCVAWLTVQGNVLSTGARHAPAGVLECVRTKLLQSGTAHPAGLWSNICDRLIVCVRWCG